MKRREYKHQKERNKVRENERVCLDEVMVEEK